MQRKTDGIEIVIHPLLGRTPVFPSRAFALFSLTFYRFLLVFRK